MTDDPTSKCGAIARTIAVSIVRGVIPKALFSDIEPSEALGMIKAEIAITAQDLRAGGACEHDVIEISRIIEHEALLATVGMVSLMVAEGGTA